MSSKTLMRTPVGDNINHNAQRSSALCQLKPEQRKSDWLSHSLKLISNSMQSNSIRQTVFDVLCFTNRNCLSVKSCLPSVACSQVCIHSIDEATDALCLSVCELPLKPGFCLMRWLVGKTMLFLLYHDKSALSSA